MRAPGIAATYPGECAKCGHDYGQGERIVRVRFGYAHVGCVAGSDE